MKGNYIFMSNTQTFANYPDVITIIDLQTMLGIGRNTAYKLLAEKAISAIRIGKKYIIPKISVINFLAEGVAQK